MMRLEKLSKHFDPIKVVCDSTATDPSRYMIDKTICIDDGNMVGTNGRMMAIYRPDATLSLPPDGCYDVAVCNAKEILLLPTEKKGRFPQWRRVIPEYKGEGAYRAELYLKNTAPTKKGFISYLTYAVAQVSNLIDIDLIEIAYIKNVKYYVNVQKDRPIDLHHEFRHGDLEVIIMPITAGLRYYSVAN